jgi:hypothetical protein
MKIQALIIVIATAIGVGCTLVMSSNNDPTANQMQPDPVAAPKGKDEKPELPPKDAAPEFEKKQPASEKAVLTQNLVLRVIRPPTGSMADEAGGSVESFRNCALSRDGLRLLTLSERSIICWDASTGLQMYNLKRGNSWKSSTYIAPDAASIASIEHEKHAVVIRKAQDGVIIGTYLFKGETTEYCWRAMPAFSPDGERFLFAEKNQDAYTYHAVSTRTGKGRVLAEKVTIRGPTGKHSPHYLFAAPGSSELLVRITGDDGGKPPQAFFTLEPRTGATNVVPWFMQTDHMMDYPGAGYSFSPDGRALITFVEFKGVNVLAWPSGQELYKLEQPRENTRHLCNGVMTPDGKRALVVNAWDRKWQIYNGYHKYGADILELHDVEQRTRLAAVAQNDFDIDQDAGPLVHRLVLSGDGMTMAFMRGDQVVLADFAAAFGIAPLPPVPFARSK